MIGKVISGGQTGVDRAALDAALELGIPIGGWVPLGRLAEDGRVPDRYPLTEMMSTNYASRTARNVYAAHATLILSHAYPLTGGTKLTRDVALRAGAEGAGLYVAILGDPSTTVETCREWLAECLANGRGGFILNVAGPRESKSPGVYGLAKAFLLEVFA